MLCFHNSFPTNFIVIYIKMIIGVDFGLYRKSRYESVRFFFLSVLLFLELWNELWRMNKKLIVLNMHENVLSLLSNWIHYIYAYNIHKLWSGIISTIFGMTGISRPRNRMKCNQINFSANCFISLKQIIWSERIFLGDNLFRLCFSCASICTWMAWIWVFTFRIFSKENFSHTLRKANDDIWILPCP